MEMRAALLESLDHCFSEYGRALKRAKHPSTKSVHEFRIASRRVMAALDCTDAWFDGKRSKRRQKPIKRGLEILSNLRDVQVIRKLATTELKSLGPSEEFA